MVVNFMSASNFNALNKALTRMHKIMNKKKGIHILHTSEISRSDREILIKTHWLETIIQGWYLVVRPDVPAGESTTWYANFWEFIKIYLEYHYGKDFCLSAECSLDLHLGAFTIPKQLIIIAKGGSGRPIKLPFETSLLIYSDQTRIPQSHEFILGLPVMSLAYALCKVSPSYFLLEPRAAEIALQSLSHPADLIQTIIQYNFKNAAERLIGAYRFLGNSPMADSIKNGLAEVGMLVQEVNPFNREPFLAGNKRYKTPYIAHIYTMWKEFRPVIVKHFPAPSGFPKDYKTYMNQVTELYSQDAYNSLSIEGYQVTPELIEKVKNAKWNPEQNLEDLQQRDALAARGYYEAFLEVKDCIIKIFKGGFPGELIEQNLSIWYQKLFAPSVRAGIISSLDLFGYRRHQVYIRNSRHTPPAKEYIGEMMEAFFQCLKEEEHPAVRAILGHFIFVYIHPYMDGNGRIGRFLMNTMLASGAYPWTIIHVNHRKKYMDSLEMASVENNILPFTKFILSEMKIT